jgi:hypothetical protein
VTSTLFAGVNEEIRIEAPVPVAPEAQAGAVWARVVRLPHGLLVSLVDLSAQDDLRWDAPKRPPAPLAGVRLGVERWTSAPPRFLFAAPEDQPALRGLDGGWDGRHDWVELPPFRTWGLVWLPDDVR